MPSNLDVPLKANRSPNDPVARMGCGASQSEPPEEWTGAGDDESLSPAADFTAMPSSISATPRSRGDSGRQATTTTLTAGATRNLSAAELASIRKEWEAISAPMATMSLHKLQKFHARILRKDGGRVLMNMRATNVIGSLQKKPIEKEIRDQARKTSVWLFKKLSYWNTETDEPVEDKTVSFEEYLAHVCRVTVATVQTVKTHDSINRAAFANSILKRHKTSSSSTTDLSASVTPQIAESLAEDVSSAPPRSRSLRFPDSPSSQQLQAEWDAQLESLCEKLKRHRHHDADEGAAFKQVKAVEKDCGVGGEQDQDPDQKDFGPASSISACSDAAVGVVQADLPGSDSACVSNASATATPATVPVPAAALVETEGKEVEEEECKLTAADESKDAAREEIGTAEAGMESTRLSGLVVERSYLLLDGEMEEKLRVVKEVREGAIRHKESLARRGN